MSKVYKLFAFAALAAFVALALVACPAPEEEEETQSSRLDSVKEAGKVVCASRNDVPGYGSLDSSGNNVGFDIDLCRALAAAVLGDSNAIELRLISAAERGPTIQSGEVTCWCARSPGRLRAMPSGGTMPRRCSMTGRDS